MGNHFVQKGFTRITSEIQIENASYCVTARVETRRETEQYRIDTTADYRRMHMDLVLRGNKKWVSKCLITQFLFVNTT